jgi:hypothetical protein
VTLATATDWGGLYARVACMNLTDPLFHAGNFAKVPLKLLRVVLETAMQQRQQETNANSISAAKLACLVYSALGGKGKGATVESFLPYEKEKDTNDLQDTTIAAMQWALKNEKMPPAIVGILGAELA